MPFLAFKCHILAFKMPAFSDYEIDHRTRLVFLQSPVEAAVFLAVEGKITPDDLKRVKRSAGESVDDIPDWFRSMDTNGNGFLEPNEIDGEKSDD